MDTVRGWTSLLLLWSRWASTLLSPVSLVSHLLSQSSELQEQEENIWRFCASMSGRCGIFFPRQTLSVELFSAPPGLLRGSSAFPTWLDFSSRGMCFVELLSLSDRVVDGC